MVWETKERVKPKASQTKGLFRQLGEKMKMEKEREYVEQLQQEKDDQARTINKLEKIIND